MKEAEKHLARTLLGHNLDTCEVCFGQGEITICMACANQVEICECEPDARGNQPDTDHEECAECDGTGRVNNGVE